MTSTTDLVVPSPVITAGTARSVVLAPAVVLDDSKAMAWEGAHQHMVSRPDIGWIMGRYVHADWPANRNGHLFRLEHLADSHLLIPSTPVNILHRATHVVGTCVASELLHPTSPPPAAPGDAPVLPAATGPGYPGSYVETLNAIWRRAFPDEWATVAEAHERGALWQCVDTETEILTAEGWKHHHELTTGEEILTLNRKTMLSEWKPVNAVYRYEVDTDLVRMRGRGHSSLTTTNHRWWVNHRKSGWQWRTSGHISSACRIPTAAPHAEYPADAKWSDDLVELVAWFWTEGTIGASDRVTIYQSATKNPTHCARIRRALTRLLGAPAKANDGGLWYESTDNRRGKTSLAFLLTKAASAQLLELAPDRRPTWAFLRSLTESQLRMFIDTSIDADGHHGDPVTFVQKDRGRADIMQAACSLLGITTTITRTHPSVIAGFPNRTLLWRVALLKRTTTNPAGAALRGKLTTVTRQRYEGIVWCPNTENQTFLARRDGTVYWTGNSMEADPGCGPGGNPSQGVTCPTCSFTHAWDGYRSPRYCEHLQDGGPMWLEHPLFLGTGIVLPPARPGWADADITELHDIARENTAVEALAGRVQEAAPSAHLTDEEATLVAAQVVARADDPTRRPMGAGTGKKWAIDLSRLRDVGSGAVTAADGKPPSAIVAIVPPDDVKAQVVAAAKAVGVDVDPDELHITLAHLRLDGVDPETQIRLLRAATAVFASVPAPFPVKIQGPGTFKGVEDGTVDCTYLSVDSVVLSNLRARLTTALGHAGFTVSTNHGFVPHMAVSYQAGPAPLIEAPLVAWTCTDLQVWSDELEHTSVLPLLGGKVPVNVVAAMASVGQPPPVATSFEQLMAQPPSMSLDLARMAYPGFDSMLVRVAERHHTDLPHAARACWVTEQPIDGIIDLLVENAGGKVTASVAGVAVYLEGDGWACAAMASWGEWCVVATASRSTVAGAIIDAVGYVVVPPEPVDGIVPIAIWTKHPMGGGIRRWARLKVAAWEDVADNYPAAIRDHLAELATNVPNFDKGGIIGLVGEPGTGKTRLIEAALPTWAREVDVAIVVDPEEMLHHADYLTEVLTAGSYRRQLVVAEDTDQLVMAREKDDNVARMLNIADGLLGRATGNGTMLVLTANLPTDQLADYVVRRAEKAGLVEFPKFEPDEASAWLLAHGADITVTSPMSLAELYALLP